MESAEATPQDDDPTGPGASPPPEEPLHRTTSKRNRPNAGTIVGAVWLPLVVLVVVGVVGYSVNSFRERSNLITSPPSDDSIPATVVPINPKNITYEVFGDLGGGGKVVYANVNSEPIEVHLDALPWSHTETTMLPSASVSLVTQVSGGSVGCRILVDGKVRDEQSVTHDSAAAACTVTAA